MAIDFDLTDEQRLVRESARGFTDREILPRARAKRPRGAPLGEVGDGLRGAMSALDGGRLSVAAGCVGICRGSAEQPISYAREGIDAMLRDARSHERGDPRV